MALSTEEQAAAARAALVNGGRYDAVTNPSGLGGDGYKTNWPQGVRDTGTLVPAVAREATAAAASALAAGGHASDASDSADAASASAGTAAQAVIDAQAAQTAAEAAVGSVSLPLSPTAGDFLVYDVDAWAARTAAQVRTTLGLATVATSGAYGDLSGRPTLGTAAALNAGTGANNVVQLTDSGQLPALDASLLTAINAPATMVRTAKTGAYTAGGVDAGNLIDCSGIWSLQFVSAATLGAGWTCVVRNAGSGTITLDPSGAETIGGATTCEIDPGEVCRVVCDGSALHVVWLAVTRTVVFETSGTYTPRPGIYRVAFELSGGGGSGGAQSVVNAEQWYLCPGGGGGYCRGVTEVTPLVPETITIGAGGAAVSKTTTGLINGNPGGASSAFGATANGGAGGPANTFDVSNGGTASGADINIRGSGGFQAIIYNGNNGLTMGGANPLGTPAVTCSNRTVNPSGHGSGGRGGVCSSGSYSQAGLDGVCIIRELS